MSLDEVSKETLRKITYEFLQDAISCLQYRIINEENLNEPLLEPFRTKLIIKKGSPEETSYECSHHTSYVLSFSLVRKLFGMLSKEEKTTNNFAILEKLDLFNRAGTYILNPQLTFFGFIIQRCLEHLTTTDDPDKFDLNDISFDQNIVDRVFDKITKFLIKDEINIDFGYVIFGIKIQGNDFVYDVNHQQAFIVPNNEKREALASLLRFRPNSFVTSLSLSQQMQWITSCSAWIQGNIQTITPKASPSLMRDKNGLLLKQIKIVPPITLEEAFRLLGFYQVQLKFFSITNEFVTGDYSLYPEFAGVRWSSSFGGYTQYPEWMSSRYDRPAMIKKGTLELSDSTIHFLKMYPAFRIQLHSDWFVSMLFNRFFRLTEYTSYNDVILEASIIWESLVTDERKEIGFQLRIKIAWLLAENVEDRKLISRIIKILYNIRSEILHNGGKKVNKIAKKIGDIQKAALIARDLTRLLLLRILVLKTNTIEIIARSELIKNLDNLLYGEKINLTTSVYFNETAPKVLSDIKEKTNHLL